MKAEIIGMSNINKIGSLNAQLIYIQAYVLWFEVLFIPPRVCLALSENIFVHLVKYYLCLKLQNKKGSLQENKKSIHE